MSLQSESYTVLFCWNDLCTKVGRSDQFEIKSRKITEVLYSQISRDCAMWFGLIFYWDLFYSYFDVKPPRRNLLYKQLWQQRRRNIVFSLDLTTSDPKGKDITQERICIILQGMYVLKKMKALKPFKFCLEFWVLHNVLKCI